MAKTKSTKRLKKNWYTVIAPDIFKNVELGDISAFTPNDLIGRCVSLSYSNLTNSPSHRTKAFTLEIVRADEHKAYTEPVKILFSTSFIGRLSRRSKTKLLFVSDYTTKDGKTVTLKGYICADGRATQSAKTMLRKRINDLLASKLKRTECVRLFEPNYIESLSKELKSKLHTVYPLRTILFWKVLVKKAVE